MIPVCLCIDRWTKEWEKPGCQRKYMSFEVHSHIIYAESDPERALSMMSSFSSLREQVEHTLNSKDLTLCKHEAPMDIYICSNPYPSAFDRSTTKTKDPLHLLISEALRDDWTIDDIPLERFFVHLKPRAPEPQPPSDVDSDKDDEEVQLQAEVDYELYEQERNDWEREPRAIDFVELDVLAFAAKLVDPLRPATPDRAGVSQGGNRGTPPSAVMASHGSGVPCSSINVVIVGPVASDPDSGAYVFDAETCIEVKHFPVQLTSWIGDSGAAPSARML